MLLLSLTSARWTWGVLCWGDRLTAGFADVLRQVAKWFLLINDAEMSYINFEGSQSTTSAFYNNLDLYIGKCGKSGNCSLISTCALLRSWVKELLLVSSYKFTACFDDRFKDLSSCSSKKLVKMSRNHMTWSRVLWKQLKFASGHRDVGLFLPSFIS